MVSTQKPAVFEHVCPLCNVKVERNGANWICRSCSVFVENPPRIQRLENAAEPPVRYATPLLGRLLARDEGPILLNQWVGLNRWSDTDEQGPSKSSEDIVIYPQAGWIEFKNIRSGGWYELDCDFSYRTNKTTPYLFDLRVDGVSLGIEREVMAPVDPATDLAHFSISIPVYSSVASPIFSIWAYSEQDPVNPTFTMVQGHFSVEWVGPG